MPRAREAMNDLTDMGLDGWLFSPLLDLPYLHLEWALPLYRRVSHNLSATVGSFRVGTYEETN